MCAKRVTTDSLSSMLLRAAALSLLLYVVLRPENVGLTPNGLDPFFYTGYAINLDDLIAGVGQHWYFVSRWTAYMPAHVTTTLFGPFAGRLLLRWLLATCILVAVWRLGRRFRWTLAQQALIGTVVITMPMFVRAFFTDYTEHTVIVCGLLLVCLCLRSRQTLWSATLIGVLAAAAVIANPVAATAVAGPVLISIWFGAERTLGRLLIALEIIVASLVTVVAGLLWFRWQYGLENVYRPTIDYIRTSPGRDPLKSPRHEWLQYYTWLYGPPIVVGAYLLIARTRRLRLCKTELVALGLCSAQYGYQWIDQFVRDGDGLEVSYYWSFMYPSLAAVLVIGLGRASSAVRSRHLLVTLVAWLAWLIVGVADTLRLPYGLGFVTAAVTVVALAAWVATARPFLAALIVLAMVAWTQIGAPQFNSSAYHRFNLSPRYDQLFRHDPYSSERMLDEAVWFGEQMDRVRNDAYASFVPLGPDASSIVGLYSPHITRRVIDGSAAPSAIISQALRNRAWRDDIVIALYGKPERVRRLADILERDTSLGARVLDVTHSSALGYRLVVFATSDESLLPFSWTPDILPVASGQLDGSAVRASEDDPFGAITFGPYVRLLPGTYRVTVSYSSDGIDGETVGSLDLVSNMGDLFTTPLIGTGSRTASVTLEFDARTAAEWEFRTGRTATPALTVESITLERATP